MTIAGYVCYFGVLLSNTMIIAMAERGGPLSDYVALIDTNQGDPWTVWVFPIFVLGNLLHTRCSSRSVCCEMVQCLPGRRS